MKTKGRQYNTAHMSENQGTFIGLKNNCGTNNVFGNTEG